MTNLKIRRGTRRDAQLGRKLMEIEISMGLPPVEELWNELRGYMDVILGRVESPIDSPYLSLAEVATAYYCRAQEIDALIHAGEREGVIMRGSAFYKFRTGELRAFLELSKRAAELGSRRLTQEDLLARQRFED